jgi:putative ABC transport system permease protein
MGVFQDFRYGFRALSKRPIVTSTAVLTLALGVGSCTVIFSAINAVLLRPLPYRQSDRLVRIHGNFMLLRMENIGVRPREFLDYRAANRVFEDTAAFELADLNLTGRGEPERLRGAFVSSGLLELLGTRQQAGRLFDPAEYAVGRDNVAVISDSLWAERYGRSADVIGTQINLNGSSYSVIGVMPPGFGFQDLVRERSDALDVWLPLAFTEQDLEHGGWSLDVIGRLKPGVTLDQARADIGIIANGFIDRYPQYRGPHGEDGGWQATVFPIKDETVGEARLSLLVLLGAVGMLLLIACANVGNLLLARGLERSREFAIRSAVGATRVRILRQLMIENLIIAALSAGSGLVVAWWARDLLIAIGAGSIPRIDAVHLDARVLCFCLSLSAVTPFLFGLLPAIKLAGNDLTDSLKPGERSAGSAHGRLRGTLVVAEVALSLVLLISAGLLMRSFIGLQRLNLGFNPDGVLTAHLDLPDSKYREPRLQAEFFQQLLGRLGSAAGADSSTLFTTAFRDPFSIGGQPFDASNPSTAFHLLVGPSYFSTLQIPLLKGREFNADDSIGAPGVAIINKALADRFFGSQDPLDRQIKVGAPGGPWLTIVGVCGDVRDRGPAEPAAPTLYMAYEQAPIESAILAVRDSNGVAQGAATIRREIGAVDKDQPIYRIEDFKDRMAGTIASPRLNALLLLSFSLIALALAIVGVYVVISYSVSQRLHEIGIRMAVGAGAADIARLVVRQGLSLALAGIALGTIGALLSTRLLSALLFNLSPTDPLTFISIPLILSIAALLACCGPALKASRVNPVGLMRRE